MTSPPSDLTDFIKTVRDRAHRLQTNARRVILLIVIVLGIGISGFVFGGLLATFESTRTRVAILQREIDATDKTIEEIQERIRSLRKGIEDETSQQKSRSSSTESLLDTLKSHLSEAQDRERLLREARQRLQEQQTGIAEQKVAPTSYELVSAVSTRVGSIILLLFLVRILVPLYRYNVRLASYYDARADALELTSLSNNEVDYELFEKLTSILSPDGIDFSEGPASPTQEVLDFVKQVVTSKKAG